MRTSSHAAFPSSPKDIKSQSRTPLIISLHAPERRPEHAALDVIKSKIHCIECFSGISKLAHMLASFDYIPDTLLIELAGDPQNILRELEALAEYVPDQIAVFAFGQLNDVEFFRALLDLGIEDYFVLPFDSAKLDLLLSKSDVKHRERHGLVIGFIGLAGGVGTTCAAVNFANFLGEKSDCDIPVIAIRSSAYAPEILYGDGVLSSRDDRPRVKFSTPDIVSLAEERQISTSIIADFGTNLEHGDLLESCDHFVIVGEPDFKSLAQASHIHRHLAAQYPFASQHFLLTQIGVDDRIEFNLGDFDKQIGDVPIYLYRYDPDAVMSALTKSYPLLPAHLLKDPNAFDKLAKRCRIPLPASSERASAFAKLRAAWQQVVEKWR